MPTLPRFVVVTSNTNGKYLRYIDEDIKNDVPAGYLKFSGQEAGSQYAKFEVEMAKSRCNEGLVHIKCCYNNKYWVRRRPDSYLIAAVADEPVEDKSKYSCTLFEPVYINDDFLVGDDKSTNHILVLRFRHTGRGEYLTIYKANDRPALSGGLLSGDRVPNPKLFDVFTVTDWESLFMMLPKYVAFKGHDGNLLGTCLNEVFASADGGLSYSSGILWRLTKGDWICLDADNSTSLKRFPVTEKITSDDSEANNEEVKELGVSKEIYNVTFRLGDAMIYNKKVVEIVMGEAVNRTQETQTVELKLSYKKTRSGSLKSSVFKLGVQSSIDGEVPIIADNGKIEVDEFAESVERRKTGTATTFTCNVNEAAVYKVVLPAMAMVKVRLLATKASYDVPFSYTERETLADGKIITNDMDDGVYCGTNTFNFKFETTEKDLTFHQSANTL
ncbi:hypothetical protein PRUPE_2G097800 [Prunus persica]|uniref:Agglutinin domain-containing protein n=1 Tax=Prunus persica TaxID=3760 RepID=A0A251QDQ7_PRUPE|nr:uncharacterized protein LOC109947365 [Prunus persica]ONI21903.1 hypothetical protein PRUPE_2G097800 [Prunus persica]